MNLLKIIGIMLWALFNVKKLAKDGAPRDEYGEGKKTELNGFVDFLSTLVQIFLNPSSSVAQDICPGRYHSAIV